MSAKGVLAWVADLLYPRFCGLCRRPVQGPEALCGGCLEGLPADSSVWCDRCGATVERAAPPAGCDQCRGKPMEFDGAVVLGEHDGPLRDLILAFKKSSHRDLASFFAERLAERLKARLAGRIDSFSGVVAVPLHPIDFILRGYNPAEELAVALARILKLPVRRWLRKRRRTRSQKRLSLEERLKNLRGVFEAVGGAHGRVLLVDDVLTTGATLSACAGALRCSGASEIRAIAVGRG